VRVVIAVHKPSYCRHFCTGGLGVRISDPRLLGRTLKAAVNGPISSSTKYVSGEGHLGIEGIPVLYWLRLRMIGLGVMVSSLEDSAHDVPPISS
jgi:hypothetical protein